jgi:hypothetical protein
MSLAKSSEGVGNRKMVIAPLELGRWSDSTPLKISAPLTMLFPTVLGQGSLSLID